MSEQKPRDQSEECFVSDFNTTNQSGPLDVDEARLALRRDFRRFVGLDEQAYQASLRRKAELYSANQSVTPSAGRILVSLASPEDALPTHTTLHHPEESDSPLYNLFSVYSATPHESSLPKDRVKSITLELKAQEVDIINNFASARLTNNREVVSKSDIGASSTITSLKARSPFALRDQLVHRRRQAEHPSLFESAIELKKHKNKVLLAPTEADRYLKDLLLSADEVNQHITETALYGTNGYIWVARIFYGGNMQKAFINASALGFNTKEAGWQSFKGTTTEYTATKNWLAQHHEELSGEAGYKLFADVFYGGDMKKAIENASTLGFNTKEAGWQQFKGTTQHYDELVNYVAANSSELSGASGQLMVADEFYKGNTRRAFVNISAAGFDTKRLGWRANIKK